MHEESSGPIQTGSQFFWIAVASFVVPFFTIIALVSWVDAGARQSAGSTDQQAKVEARIQPVSQVQIGSDGAADVDADAGTQAAASEGETAGADAGDAASGQEVYEAMCAACHGTGVAGAPKLGDNDAWAPRIETGYDALLHSALEGKGAMPPQGGGKYSDAEIGHAVVYMANQSGGQLSEPGTDEAADAPAEAEAAPAAEEQETAAADETGGEQDNSAAEEKTSEAEGAEAADDTKAAPAAAAAADGAAAADDAEASDDAADAAAGVDLAAGQALYEKACAACHGTGVAGAPKLGDKDVWEPRIAEGMDAMMHIAINGKGAMPPRGATTASDEELRDAVLYMVNEVDPDFVQQQSAQ